MFYCAVVWHRLAVEEAEVGLVAVDVLAVKAVVVGGEAAGAGMLSGEKRLPMS